MIKPFLFSTLCTLSIACFATDYLVTSTDDSGAGTLREAISLLQEGDTIYCQSTLAGTITLQSDLPEIPVDTSITGPSSGAVTIDGASAYQIFTAHSYVSISNFILQNVKTSSPGGAILINDSGVVLLDTMTIPHCDTSCEAPIHVSSNGTLVTNNVQFSNPSNSGVDILFEDGSFAVLGCDSSVVPQVWVQTNGGAVVYKEGEGILEIKTAATADMQIIADTGTLLFADTTSQPILALPSGTISGASTSNYVVNLGLVNLGTNFGTLTNTADYYQISSANLVAKIDADANTDLVEAFDIGYLNGNLIIQLAPGYYTASTAYTLVTCAGGFNSPFENVYFNFPVEGLQSLSNASLSYTADSVVLTITSDFTVASPMSFASTAILKKPPVAASTSPVNDLYAWMVKHKKKPKGNVRNVLKNYVRDLQQTVKKLRK